MKLLRLLIINRGFTLLEVVLVVAILTILFVLVTPITLHFYQQNQLDSEFNLLQSTLRQARNFSMVNRNESAFGLYIDASNFTVFQGATYASRTASEDLIYPRSQSITIVGPSELNFESLSGRVASSTFTLTNTDSRVRTLFINSEGLVYQ